MDSVKAFILAAGLGTRLRPLTDHTPKALVEIHGKPLLAHLIDKLTAAGISEIIVNVHHHAALVEEWLREYAPAVAISDESEQLLDTGGAVKRVAALLYEGSLSSPLLVHNVDIVSDLDLRKLLATADLNATTLVVSERASSRRLLFDGDMRLIGWHNTQTDELRGCTREEMQDSSVRSLAFSGIHLFAPQLFPLMAEWGDKFSIIDFYLSVCRTQHIYGYIQPDLQVIDAGKPETLSLIRETTDFERFVS